MKRISIQGLKARLSAAIAEAQEGQTIVITRHRTPVAQLGPAGHQRVHRGRLADADDPLRPAIRRGTRGRYLDVLAEDRNAR